MELLARGYAFPVLRVKLLPGGFFILKENVEDEKESGSGGDEEENDGNPGITENRKAGLNAHQ